MQSHIAPKKLTADEVWGTMQSITSESQDSEKMVDSLIDDLGRVSKNAWDPKPKASKFFSGTNGPDSPKSETRTAIAARRLIAELKDAPESEDKERKLPRQRTDRLFACLQNATVVSLIDERSEVAILLAHFFSRFLPTKVVELSPELLQKLYPAPIASDIQSNVSVAKEFKSLLPNVTADSLFTFFLNDLETIIKRKFSLDTCFMRNMLAANWLCQQFDGNSNEDSLIGSLQCEAIVSRIDEDSDVAELLRNVFQYIPDRLIDIPAQLCVKFYTPKSQLKEEKTEKDGKEELKSYERNANEVKTGKPTKGVEALAEVKKLAEEKESEESNAKFEKLLKELCSGDDQTTDILGILEKSSPKQLEERLSNLFNVYSSFVPQLKTGDIKYQHHIVFLTAVVNKLFEASNVRLFTFSTLAMMTDFFSELIYISTTFNLGSLALERLRANGNFHKKFDKVTEPFLNSDFVSTKNANSDQVISITRMILTLFIYICYLNPLAGKIVKKLFELMDDSLNKMDEYNKGGPIGELEGKQKIHFLHNLSQIASTLACLVGCFSYKGSEKEKENEEKRSIRAEIVRRVFVLIANYDFLLMSGAFDALLSHSSLNISEAAKLASILRAKSMEDGRKKKCLSKLSTYVQKELLRQYANPECNLGEWSKESFPASKSPDVARLIWSYVTTEPAPSVLRR